RCDMARPPHEARNAPATLEGRPLLAAERCRAGVRISIEPGTIVSGENHDGVRRIGPDLVHDLADVVVHLHERVRIVAKMGLAPPGGRGIGWIVHLDEVYIHEEGLIAFRM